MHAQQSNISSTKKAPLNKNMDTTISTPSPIHCISKNKESYDVISSNNKVTDTTNASSPSSFSSYKKTLGFFTNHTYIGCQYITDNIGTDQTGRFVVPSFRGNNYLLILFYLDRNSISSEPIPNLTKKFIKKCLCQNPQHT